ncbi:sugar transferase [Mucilaginibacter sp. RS28]|uniref:Sugar transferase n=1 Tax=Mucilaginibacter straminoryzae TaxID=2932774 RepID=A0A9X1X5F1_9SPHI|nr:sugar transferase [Mucilaginibacter straminoryzae]MCJ8211268.1 sugar transferase [Mucilaginibacter straminoryzae]
MSDFITADKGVEYIAVIHAAEDTAQKLELCDFEGKKLLFFNNGVELAAEWENKKLAIACIISQSEILGPSGISLLEGLKNKGLPKVPFFLISNQLNSNLRKLALSAGVVDTFKVPVKYHNVATRVNFIIRHWSEIKSKVHEKVTDTYTVPIGKRIFDIVFSGMALLFLSPVFLLIYLLVRLESKGPAFYYSLRVGTGYRVFKFYKFRSMYVNADKRLKDLSHLNQYNIDAGTADVSADPATPTLCNDCLKSGKCQFPIYADKNSWCEKDYSSNKKFAKGSAFFKIKNDPRITKVGNFIRNTSLDELPQLWNVFIGDMSLVGNRPLPLYEAEKLTTDKYALRFHAPAGITGLWQVEKRGKGEMSEEERLMLDNMYAKNHSLRNDLRLIFKTIPALLQKESV